MIIKLLQWNIYYKKDVRNILKLLQKIDADIVCLQELTTSSRNKITDVPAFLGERLDFSYYFKAGNTWNLPEVN